MSTPPPSTAQWPLGPSLALEGVSTGDLVFMNRKCLAMKDPLGIGLCLLTKTENRFDHVGMIVKLSSDRIQSDFREARKKIVKESPSGTYVLETNMKGVTLLSAEDRIGRSSAHEIVVRPLRVGSDASRQSTSTRMLQELENMYSIPYQSDMWSIFPSIFSPPDKMDRIDAAYKIHQLEHEAQAIDRALSSASSSTASFTQHYKELRDIYKNSQQFLAETYFPHLGLGEAQAGDFCRPSEWQAGHFWFDGTNQATQMVCSEFICNLWQRTGLLNGFAPASSNRPFDLLDDTRLNSLGDKVGFAPLFPLKTTDRSRKYWDGSSATHGLPTPLACVDESWAAAGTAPIEDASFEEKRLAFLNAIRTTHCLSTFSSIDEVTATARTGALLPFQWLVQSAWSTQVERDLPYRLAGAAVVFSVCAVPVAPLTLRWMESQCGLFLVRGSVWSLASGVLARNLTFAAAQGLFAWAVLRVTTEAPEERAPRSVFYGTHSRSSLVDTRHPYYTVVTTMLASAVCAHVVTTPIFNSTVSYHFGPLRPGPLPLRLLCHGCLSMAPLAALLPMQAYWLSWYETGSSFIVPVRSSVLRARPDLLEDPRWPHFRNDALVGSFLFMCGVDALLYPVRTASLRRLMRKLYAPQGAPTFGPRLFPGYRYRAISNLLIFSLTTAFFHGASAL